MAPKLTANFRKTFKDGPTVEADLEFSLADPVVTVLFGPSGSGKTTILRCLAGLEEPTEGRIAYDDEVWFDNRTRVKPQRRRVGYLSQRYALFPHLTVTANVAYGLKGVPRAQRHARVGHLLKMCGLEGLEQRHPRKLSGGQQQRVALARALAGEPRLILLDEPLAALDTPMRAGLARELRELLVASGLPAVAVTHDRNEALLLGDELVLLHDGHIVQSGPVASVLTRPASVEAAEIVGIETVVAGHVTARDGMLARVDVNGAGLTALDPDLLEGDVWVCIRASDVTLESGQPVGTTARNRLQGVIQRVSPQDPLVRVDIDCGFTLAAAVTNIAANELALHPGQTITASVKAPNVHLIAHVPHVTHSTEEPMAGPHWQHGV